MKRILPHQYNRLLHIAKRKMKHSPDPIHDLAHVKRVVSLAKTIGRARNLNEEQMQVLMLATWWHDTGRTLHPRASFVFMLIIDDMLSSCMLWWHAMRAGINTRVVRDACRVLFASGFVSNGIVRDNFLHKNIRPVYHILHDADMIDVINVSRVQKIQPLIDSNKLFNRGYRWSLWWFLHVGRIQCKTQEANDLLKKEMEAFIEWATLEQRDWHINLLSEKTMTKYIGKAKAFVASL